MHSEDVNGGVKLDVIDLWLQREVLCLCQSSTRCVPLLELEIQSRFDEYNHNYLPSKHVIFAVNWPCIYAALIMSDRGNDCIGMFQSDYRVSN